MIKINKTDNITGKDMEQLELSHTRGACVKWYHYFVELFLALSSRVELMHVLWPRNFTPEYIPKRNVCKTEPKTCTIMFIAVFFIIASNYNYMLINNRFIHKLWYIHTMKYCIAMKIYEVELHNVWITQIMSI